MPGDAAPVMTRVIEVHRAVNIVQIAAAHAGCFHTQQDLPRSGFRHRELPQFNLALTANDHCTLHHVHNPPLPYYGDAMLFKRCLLTALL
jgi:hypothetical protein